MMREFAYFCRTHVDFAPPFVILVAVWMVISLALYWTTKSRGFLITSLSGLCYMVPWFLQSGLR
jgi:hypothetical protein